MELDFPSQLERIKSEREGILETLKESHPRIAEVLSEGLDGHLVSSLSFSDQPEAVYILIDFTAKQEDYLDLEGLREYTCGIYEKFMGEYNLPC